MAEEKKKEKAAEAPKPEEISLKEVAKQAGVSPREARAILRKVMSRGDDEKRSRWNFAPKDVAGTVAKIKAAVVEKAKAKAEKEAAEEEGE